MLAAMAELVSALDITWHTNPEDEIEGKKDPAKTAPKSQRYWDEHGIVKPDYAYTDDEIRQRQKQQDQGTSSLPIAPTVMVAVGSCFVLGMAAGLYVLHVARSHNTHRLGGQEEAGGLPLVSVFMSWLRTALDDQGENQETTEEKERLARVARFDASLSSSSSVPHRSLVDKSD
jgi:hypothetical protein